MNALLKLLRSMRFAIGILTVVAVAATVGSVLEQNQPTAVYVSRYGAVWSAFYSLSGLDDIYHAWWFFGLLGFMATSTGLCLWQNTPSMLRDMRSYRENKSVASLRKLEYCTQLEHVQGSERLNQRLRDYLKQTGYNYATTLTASGALFLAARRGAARRAGYLLVHSAMVLICVGGLIDGNVWLRLRLWTGAAKIETRDLPPGDVPKISRIAANAGSFRATMNLPEGDTGSTALLPIGDGYLVQELPFRIRLKRFRVEHYASGQPKDFASDIEIIDGKTVLPVTLHVNKPYTYRGVTLYQSGFADGGSDVGLELTASSGSSEQIKGKIGGDIPFLLDGKPYTLELADLRLINVFAKDDGGPAADWHSHAKPGERVHDVGPSLGFRLRDQVGQADDWLLYQKPATIDGANWFLIGRRVSQEKAMRFWRLPADADSSLTSYHKFTRDLLNPVSRQRAAKAVAARANDARAAGALEVGVANLLEAFAKNGYRALAELIPANATPEEQLRTGQLYASLLENAAATLSPSSSPTFAHNMLSSYSEVLDAKLPAIFQLKAFTPANSSGIQLTRAPGANLVYLGAALLALGVIAMYFVPERRLWLRMEGTQLLVAFTANRPSPGLQVEFDKIRSEIISLTFSDREAA